MRQAPITTRKLFARTTWGKILNWVLTIALVCGAVFGCIAVVRAIESDTRVVSGIWKRGELDEDGLYSESKESIYSKLLKVDGMTVTLDFDATVKYKIFFYDEDEELLASNGTTSALTGNFAASSIPTGAKYARIVVTPIDDDNISIFEIVKYGGQLTIEVNK